MEEDPYSSFADRYDLFYKEFGRHSETTSRFFETLFRREGTGRLLDCACGTGHHLVLFSSLGLEVSGSDISPAMLERARKNLAGLGVDIDLHEVDYRKLPEHFSSSFDAVTCLSSSILHMPTDEEVVRALNSMGRILRPGGILILSQGTSDRQWREKPRFLVGASGPEFLRLFVIDYLDRGARYNILDIFWENQIPSLKVWSTEYEQVLLKRDIHRCLRKAGFGEVEFFGSYGGEPYSEETSGMLLSVARWPGPSGE